MTESIAKMEFFSGLDPKLLRKLEESAIVCQFGRDEVIIKEGEMGLGMYVILRGRVGVSKVRDGIAISLAELGPEQCFAEMSLIDEKPRSATVTTLDETECLLLTRDSFTKLMGKNPQLAIRLAKVLAERLRQADERSQAMPDSHEGAATAAAAASNGTASSAPAPEKNLNGAASNGASSSASSNLGAIGSGKAALQQKLLDTFERLYTVKAFTRFSVAVLGCPVEGTAPNLIEEIRLGEIKALVVPAGEPLELQIGAFGGGAFNLHVFTPEHTSPVRFGPIPIQPTDRFTLRLPEMTLQDHNNRMDKPTAPSRRTEDILV